MYIIQMSEFYQMSFSNSKYQKFRVKLSDFNKMQKEIQKKYSNSICTRASFIKKNIKSKYFFFPNFLIDDSQINLQDVLPKNNENISRESVYDEKIEDINKSLPQLEKAIGTLYACRYVDSLLTDFNQSTISVVKYKEELVGITCLHLLGCYESLERVILFINFGDVAIGVDNFEENELIKLGFIKVEIYPNFLEKRQEFLKVIESGSAEDIFHDNKSSMHPYPTFDLLVIKLPDFLINEKSQNNAFLEFDQNFVTNNLNNFCYFIGYHSACEISIEEYKNSPQIMQNIDARSLVYLNRKSLTFGEIIKNENMNSMIWAILINTFPLSSGSALLSENNKIIGFLGLSFADDQTRKDELHQNEQNKILPLHLSDIAKCSENILENESFNYNLCLNTNKLFFLFLNDLMLN